MRQFFLTFPKAEIFQSVIEKSSDSAALAPIGQSVIGQFSGRSSMKLTRALERLGQIARAFRLRGAPQGRSGETGAVASCDQ
jgi:hypothetical protein